MKRPKLIAFFQKYKLIFKQPAGTSRGIINDKDTWFLKIWDIDFPDKHGIGECSLLKGLSVDNRPGYEKKLEWLCNHINDDPNDLDNELADWPSLRFGLEMALADLRGGGTRILFPSSFTKGEKAIPINGLIWMGDRDFMQRQIDEKIGQGFTVIKLKVGAIDFDSERSLLSYIRKKNDSGKITIRLDANGAFTAADVFRKLEQLSEFQVHSIEQPVRAGQHDLMVEVCRNSPIPVALDEELIGVNSLDAKRKLLETIRPQYIVLKPSLLGGFSACNQWISLATEMNIGWWVTSALESNIGLNAIAQWTATLGNPMPQGLGTGSLYVNNISAPLKVENGFLHFLPDGNWDLNLSDRVPIKCSWQNYNLTLNGVERSGDEWLIQADLWESDNETEPWLKDIGRFLKQWFSDNESVSVHTSGSTGNPKEYMIEKRAMLESARATGEYLDLHNHPDALLCLSARYIAGMMMIVRAMVYGQNLIAVRPDGNPMLSLNDFNIPSFAAMVPAQVFNCLNHPISVTGLKNIRTLIIGGGEINPLLEQQMKDFPNAIFATYGMTETITHIALRRINGKNRSEFYKALPGITLSTDYRGCLVINVPRISSMPIVTNDVVTITGNTDFCWRGRFDNVINRGGEKLFPEEIEKKISGIMTNRFFITAISDPKFGQVPALVIESKQADYQYIENLKTTLKNVLSKSEMPIKYFFIRNFMEVANGKIDRRETFKSINTE